MANLYRLLIPQTDEMRFVLNGRNFNIKKTPDNRLVFVNPDDHSVLLKTTEVIKDSGESESNVREFRTSSGSVYCITKLDEECNVPEVMEPEAVKDVPTEAPATDESIQALVEEYENIKVVNEVNVHRHIEYGDGYNGTVFTFAEPVSYEAFLLYCEKNDLDLDKLKKYAWYEDHAHVSPNPIKNEARWNTREQPAGKPGDKSTVWTYLWIRAYTD